MSPIKHTIFAHCLCNEVLKTLRPHDDPQVRMTTAEGMTVVLVADAFYGDKWECARVSLKEHGFIPEGSAKVASVGASTPYPPKRGRWWQESYRKSIGQRTPRTSF